ncbi:MAG: VanW family protein [Chitinophagaceae bacterium]|nr:VanW family protein [Chitinophagaceae bacterium]
MFISGKYFMLANSHNKEDNLFCVKEITQALKKTPTSASKKHNLSIAIKQLNNVVIRPNQIFSFWHLVGNPTQKKGYQNSRAIVNNELKQEIGGGLCQLSGLIYYLALHAGMQIIERHHHSIDIYTDKERFTPLGSDATVAYGYKDLQFKNVQPFPIYLQFTLTDNLLTGHFLSPKYIDALDIRFCYQKNDLTTLVTTNIYQADILLHTFCDVYKNI